MNLAGKRDASKDGEDSRPMMEVSLSADLLDAMCSSFAIMKQLLHRRGDTGVSFSCCDG